MKKQLPKLTRVSHELGSRASKRTRGEKRGVEGESSPEDESEEMTEVDLQ